MEEMLSAINRIVWGIPGLLLIIGVGLFYSLRLSFVQLRLLPGGLKAFLGKFRKQKTDGSFRALCTALGATVGTGNLVGVAGAICLGGPGAVFWMWICGILGMVTKYAEAVLAVRYRLEKDGELLGGPMYVISQGLGSRFVPLAKLYCAFGLVAAFGVGNAAQVNAVITGIRQVAESYSLPNVSGFIPAVGLGLAVLLGWMLSGGARRITDGAQRLVPLAAAGYILLCLGILVMNGKELPGALQAIFTGAFSPRAVTGGALGSAFLALRIGCSRGVFTNEAGMGTAAIAHGAANVAHPVEQGLMGIVEVFLDTIVICTLTALVILVSGVPVPYGVDAGAELTLSAFEACYGKAAGIALTGMLCAFAIATVLGWSFYGARCAQYLFGRVHWHFFAWTQALVVLLASMVDTAVVWQFSETVNGLMLIPNVIALILLSGEVVQLTRDYRGLDKRVDRKI